jgi:putative sterol carrier protein
MKIKPGAILSLTSFFSVVIFNLLARVGEAPLKQIRMAAVAGLVLAGVQMAFSRKVLKRTTYLERAFMGFLAAGTAWVYFTTVEIAPRFVEYSDPLLYIVLCMVALVPQLFGYDPFTYAIAKQWYPEIVWNTPQFRTINLHITYVWSIIFFSCFLSTWLGHGKPLFSTILPIFLNVGVGLLFSRKYPEYYLSRRFASRTIDPSAFPPTARELVYRMPVSFSPQAASGVKADIQFNLSGEGGGKIVLSIADGQCTVREGQVSAPTLAITSPGEVWLKMARGEINRPKALMEGLFKVEGDMNLLMKMGELFQPPAKAE